MFTSIVICLCGSSCSCENNDDNEKYSNSPITSNTKFILNTTNVNSYIDMELIDNRQYYDTGYVFQYKLFAYINGGLKTAEKVTMKFTISFKYTYLTRYTGTQTSSSSDSGQFVIPKGVKYYSNSYSAVLLCKMPDLLSCSYSIRITDVQGYLVSG